MELLQAMLSFLSAAIFLKIQNYFYMMQFNEIKNPKGVTQPLGFSSNPEDSDV